MFAIVWLQHDPRVGTQLESATMPFSPAVPIGACHQHGVCTFGTNAFIPRHLVAFTHKLLTLTASSTPCLPIHPFTQKASAFSTLAPLPRANRLPFTRKLLERWTPEPSCLPIRPFTHKALEPSTFFPLLANLRLCSQTVCTIGARTQSLDSSRISHRRSPSPSSLATPFDYNLCLSHLTCGPSRPQLTPAPVGADRCLFRHKASTTSAAASPSNL